MNLESVLTTRLLNVAVVDLQLSRVGVSSSSRVVVDVGASVTNLTRPGNLASIYTLSESILCPLQESLDHHKTGDVKVRWFLTTCYWRVIYKRHLVG